MFNFFKPKFNVSELTHHPERDGSIRIIIDHVTYEFSYERTARVNVYLLHNITRKSDLSHILYFDETHKEEAEIELLNKIRKRGVAALLSFSFLERRLWSKIVNLISTKGVATINKVRAEEKARVEQNVFEKNILGQCETLIYEMLEVKNECRIRKQRESKKGS